MASNRMSGNLLGLEINGEFVSCETSCEFNFEADMRPASPILSGRWKEFIAGVRSWSVNINAAMLIRMVDGVSVHTVLNAFLTGSPMSIRFMVKNPALANFIISGDVMVQNGAISGQVNTLAGWSSTLVGNGPFTLEVNTNLVYVIATDDVGDELLEDGNLNLIEGEPGGGQEVTVSYSVNFGSVGGSPATATAIHLYKNGAEVTRKEGEGTSTIIYNAGDTLQVLQYAYAALRWAPGSVANLTIKIDGVTWISTNVTDQNPVLIQNSGGYVIPEGVSYIEVISTGSNESLNYFVKNLSINSNLEIGEFGIFVSDNVEAGLGIYDLRTGTGFVPFNVKGTTGNLTVTLTNLKSTDITYTLTADGGYLQTGTIPAFGSVTHNDVTKGGLFVDVSNI